MPSKPTLAITMGDPGGIGPEVILKTLKSYSAKQKRPLRILLIGSRPVFELAAKKCGISLSFNLIPEFKSSLLKTNAINFLDVSTGIRQSFAPAKISRVNGLLALKSLEMASQLAGKGQVQAIVTAPVHKEAMRYVARGFVGHTEFLAQASEIKEFAMLFYSKYFCVTLETIHLALKKVPSVINQRSIFSKIKLTHAFLKNKLGIRCPRIAVTCLNPHGSEFGSEEASVIIPAIQKARRHHMHVNGPLPGDQVFHEAYHGKFDAVISMYHDQGLAPFKMIAFDTGVNVTLGLPYIRTSPDHGTAFDIAYQNKANPTSFSSALKLAAQLIYRTK